MVAIVTVVQTILPNRLLHLLQILVHHWKMFGISISLVLLYFECRCRIFVGSTKWKRCLHKSILIFDWVGSAYQELNMQSKMCFGLILPAKECHIASSVQQILTITCKTTLFYRLVWCWYNQKGTYIVKNDANLLVCHGGAALAAC